MYTNETFIEKVLAVFKQKKILGNVCFSEQIFYRERSLGAPVSFSNVIPESLSISEYQAFMEIRAVVVVVVVGGGGVVWGGEERNDYGRLIFFLYIKRPFLMHTIHLTVVVFYFLFLSCIYVGPNLFFKKSSLTD